MSTITLKDGTTVYYKDWGSGSTLKDQVNAQLLAFFKGAAAA